MTRILMTTLFASIALLAALATEEPPTTFWVQLVRGSDEDKPPKADAKPIGPKLSQRLRPVFRWKKYWQMNRAEVKVAPGKTAKVRLSDAHEVEIDLKTQGKRIIRFYGDGKLVSALTHPVGESLDIQGGDSKTDSAWFIVVRRDRPQD